MNRCDEAGLAICRVYGAGTGFTQAFWQGLHGYWWRDGTRVDHPGDGRGVLLELTPAGRRLWTRSMDVIDQRNADIFGCLSAQEQATLSGLFDRLIAHNRRD